jgi:succinoglycan biosynthesis transport protein ExoP
MLQASEPLSLESAATQETSFRELAHWAIGIVRRQLWVIALIGAVGTSLGVFYVLIAPSTYTAESRIAIDPRRVQLFPKATFSEGQIDGPALDSEIVLVQSEPVVLSVVNGLGLAKDPEFLKSPGVLGALLGFASHLFSLVKPTKPLSESEATKVAVTVLSKNLLVFRVGGSYNLSIQYRSANPERAVQIANAIVEAYIAKQIEVKYEPTRRATQWLEGRIEELNQKLKHSERLVVDFKKTNDMITVYGKLVNEQRIADLTSQLATAQSRTSEAKARLDRIDAVLRDNSLRAQMGSVADTAMSLTGVQASVEQGVRDTLNSGVFTQLRARYLELANREANWSRKYGANHGAVVNLRDEISQIQRSFLEELKRLKETYINSYETVKQEEQSLEERIADAVSRSQPINEAQITSLELESNAKNLRAIYDNFRQRYADSLQQQSFPISDASITARAALPLEKSGPKMALILVMAAAGGLGFGVAVGILRELMDGSFYTKEQVESALQTRCIAVVPSLKSDKGPTLIGNSKPMLSFDRGLGAGLNNQRTISRDSDICWAVLNAPFSRFAEEIRSIKLAVERNNGGANSWRVIGFTSSLPQEGKSTIAASLALLMAQAGARVILVDCDLRNPSLSRKLTPNADHGILDVIAGRMTLKNAVWTDQSTNLTFLPAVTYKRLIYSSDILSADATRKLFENLQSRYDYVLVDLTPLVPIVDTWATRAFVDCYIFVIEWGRTTSDAVKHAFRGGDSISENMVGIVLNKADINQLSRYYPTGENYYRNKHYTQYGFTE